MNRREMQENVEIELRQYDIFYEDKNKLESKEIFYYLSRSERDYVQDIYDAGIEKNEENKKKLGSLLLTKKLTNTILTLPEVTEITTGTFYDSSYVAILPSGLLYTTGERADIGTKVDEVSTITYKNVLVKPSSYDEITVNKSNPFRKETIKKCLRLEGNGEHIIITPDLELINLYIDYIKTPLGINLDQDCELHESVHYNIVKGAVKLILAAKQNQVGYSIQSREEKENK